ncbi:MAG: hypothetical protein ACHQ49_01030 [Elusimicrobiota bacterium]
MAISAKNDGMTLRTGFKVILLVHVLVFLFLLFVMARTGFFNYQFHRFGDWIYQHIPVWMEVGVCFAVCIMSVTLFRVPRHSKLFFLMLLLIPFGYIVAIAGVEKLPDPWEIYMELALLFNYALFLIRGRLSWPIFVRSPE